MPFETAPVTATGRSSQTFAVRKIPSPDHGGSGSKARLSGSLGIIIRPSYEAPIFLGFNSMPFHDGKGKFEGVARSCGFQ